MNLSICTISFRHQLISIEQLLGWAQSNHFQAIELWGIHANNLADQGPYDKDWLKGFGLYTSMISDYLPLQGPEPQLYYKVQRLSRLCKLWGTGKLRTFAGDQASDQTSAAQRRTMVLRLRSICEWVAQHGISLIVEIHPNTLADTVESTLQLIDEVAHASLRINFDVLHVWESGANTLEALDKLAPYIQHFHLKNIASKDMLDVFSPANVYAAAGSREGMVPLFEGAVDFREFLEYVMDRHASTLADMDASLEWFGHHAQKTLRHDRYLIQQLQQRCQNQAIVG